MTFARNDYTLTDEIVLTSLSAQNAQDAGERLAKISPWLGINKPETLEKYLLYNDPAVYKYAVLHKDKLAGVVCVRSPWLKGPYLELLGLFPEFQGKKIGSKIMSWFEKSGESRNLWLLASDFNLEAIIFYERHGFVRIATLDNLSADGVHDIMMRKKMF